MDPSEHRRFAHACLMVEDIHEAIDNYKRILGVVDPKQTDTEIVFYEDFGVGEERLAFATFVAPGLNCEIQLMQPKTPGTPLYERLQKRGEHVHHLCFTSPDVDAVVEELDEEDIGIVPQGMSVDPQMPWQCWTFIDPSKSHGVLIELANNYRGVNGKWEPAEDVTWEPAQPSEE